MDYILDVGVAMEVGPESAIIFKKIEDSIFLLSSMSNTDKKDNEKLKVSIKKEVFEKMFSFLTPKEIEKAVNCLVDYDYILSGKTDNGEIWFSLSDRIEKLYGLGERS